MPEYPYCIVADVQKRNQHRPTYSATTKPTETQVESFIDEIAAHLRAICEDSGYNLDNLSNSGTVALGISAGSDVVVAVASGEGSNFSVGDEVFIQGLSADAVRQVEFDIVTDVTGDSVAIATVDNTYAAASVTINVLNDAMTTLRRLNSVGAAWKAERDTFMGTSPNKSEHAEALEQEYFGSEESCDGIWAIKNVEDYLRGAETTDEAIEEHTITSYGANHSTDTDVAPEWTRESEL